jgi:neutral ceramidase
MADGPLLVGRGIADITGEAAGGELLGYGKADQIADGLHLRLRARAFVFADGDQRLLVVVNDLGMVFDSVHREVLARLRVRFGGAYTADNTILTATHTHAGCGGFAHHNLYILGGYHPANFEAVCSGIVEAVARAHADVAPATLRLAHGRLTDASTNRSPTAFARNPAEERAVFPEGIDPQTTVLAAERGGELVGYLNLFATHGTSMTNRNRLVSGDNKGYAAWHAEHDVAGGDHLAGRLPVIAAFAQTNAGDMSPNLDRAPGCGPTGDERANTAIIGRRQQDAAAALAALGVGDGAREVTGPIDVRRTVIDLSDFPVASRYTDDGWPHRTTGPAAGAAGFAGTDEGPGFRGFRQGVDQNPVWSALAEKVMYRLDPPGRSAHRPKAVVVPATHLNTRLLRLVQERVPVSLVRLGPLHLLAIPGEVTIVAGLRLRRAVAEIVGADVEDVLVLGYANAYIHYVTTPEEYDEQRYEGGSTLYGRWELGAFVQTAVELAEAMRDGRPAATGPEPPDLSGRRRFRPGRGRPPADRLLPGERFGQVLAEPRARYRGGDVVRATFVAAHPANDLHRGGTFLAVERRTGGSWDRVADDGDWSTTVRWTGIDGRPLKRRRPVRATATWEVPPGTPAGTYRMVLFGDAVEGDGRIIPFTGETAGFEIVG